MTDSIQAAMPWASPTRGDGDEASTPVTFEATVDRVVFPRVDKGDLAFRVITVTPTDRDQPTKWIGEVPPVRSGVKYCATGVVERDRQDSSRLVVRVSSLGPVVEKTAAGILAYLASGAIPHIRESMAKKIVKLFGADTLDILDKAPWRLGEVPGIKADSARLKKIVDAWTAQRSTAANMMWLLERGLTNYQAKRIFEEYGAATIARVTENPYRLAEDVDGIGFARADEIAMKIGIASDDPRRDAAAVLHAIAQAGDNDGHTYVARSELVKKAAKLTGAPEPRSAVAIATLLEQGALVRIPIPGGIGEEAILSKRFAWAETNVAKRLLALLAAKPSSEAGGVISPECANKAIEAFEAASKMTLAPAQREAVMMAATSQVMVLTGAPGTGKTQVTRAILALFKGLQVKLCSPTGKAAMRMSELTGHPASTIHVALAFNPSAGGFQFNEKTPLNSGVILVDESSMCDLSITGHLLDAIKVGARLIIIGDVDQLPSVGPGAVLRDIIASGVVPTTRLTQIFRQAAGSRIKVAAADMNSGIMPASDEGKVGEFYMLPHPRDITNENPMTAERAADLVLKLACFNIPRAYGYNLLAGEIMVLTPMHAGPSGTVALNEILRAQLNPSGPPELKRGDRIYRVGDRVIERKNDSKRGIFNGDTGVILEIRVATAEDPTVLVAKFDDRVVMYEPKKLSTLHLAYAISIHSSQGSEAKAVIVVALNEHYIMLARNLIYTAATRASKLCVMVTTRKAMRTALSETRRGARNTLLSERLQGLV